MANASKYPALSDMIYFQWSTPTYSNPKLAAPISATATTITFTAPPLDENGVVVTEAFLMGIRNSDSYVETVLVPAGGLSVDGLTATGCVRGIRLLGLDWTTGDSSLAVEFDQDSAVFCNISGITQALHVAALQGTIATGGTGFTIGTEPGAGGETVTLYRTTTAGVKKGLFRWYVTSGKAEYSNDGTTWNSVDSATASNLVVVSGTDTTASNLQDKITVTNGTITITNPAGDENLNLDIHGNLADLIDDVTATATELNQLAGISASVTDTALNALVDGGSADAYHSHTYPSRTGIADESITTGQHIAEIPYGVEWYTQLTDTTTIALGDDDARRKYDIKFIPPKTISSWANLYLRMAEAVNGATATGDLTIRIETDNAGEPSGTLGHANATATVSQVTQRTWNTTQATRTIAWAGAVSLVKGTTYHLVIACSATQAANYIKIGVNSAYDENYCTFTRKTYSQTTGTWGGAVTNSTPYFWGDVSLGSKLVPTDANFGRRAFNYIGVSSGNYAADAAVTYYYDLVPASVLAAVPVAGSDYYISVTAGEISTSIPDNLYGQNFAYKVGKGSLNSSSTIDFKIETGLKKSWGSAAPTGAATTVHSFITWFNPSLVIVSGSYVSSATISHLTLRGIYNGTSNYSTVFMSDDGGAEGTSTNTDASFGGDDFAGAYWKGVGSGNTNAGFTYTVTKTSTPSDYSLMWEATA